MEYLKFLNRRLYLYNLVWNRLRFL